MICKELRASTSALITVSSVESREGEVGDSDFLDWDIIPIIEKLNHNDHFVPTGSCSGHDGYPFLSVVFGDDRSRDKYIALFQAKGYTPIKSTDLRLSFFTYNFPQCHVTEEWSVENLSPEAVTEEHAKQMWDDWVKILTN